MVDTTVQYIIYALAFSQWPRTVIPLLEKFGDFMAQTFLGKNFFVIHGSPVSIAKLEPRENNLHEEVKWVRKSGERLLSCIGRCQVEVSNWIE